MKTQKSQRTKISMKTNRKVNIMMLKKNQNRVSKIIRTMSMMMSRFGKEFKLNPRKMLFQTRNSKRLMKFKDKERMNINETDDITFKFNIINTRI
jgi:hypothetical protein